MLQRQHAGGGLVQKLAEIPFAIICDNRHPLADKAEITFDDVARYPLFTYPLEGHRDYHAYVERVAGFNVQETFFHYQDEAEFPILKNPYLDLYFGMALPWIAKQSRNTVIRNMKCGSFKLCVAMLRSNQSVHVSAAFETIGRAAAAPEVKASLEDLASDL